MRETTLAADDFIHPLFLLHGQGVRQEISSMPGVYHLSIDQLAAEATELMELGVPGVILFGLPEHKDPVGLENFAPRALCSGASAPSRQRRRSWSS